MSVPFWAEKETKGMIIDTVTGNGLEFQYNPDRIKINYTPQYVDHDVPGLRFPVSQWVNGSNKIIDFTLEFFAEDENSFSVRDKVEFLESFLHPDFRQNSKIVKAPKILLFVFGQFFTKACEMRDCVPVYEKMFEKKSLAPKMVSLKIKLKEIELEVPNSSVINPKFDNSISKNPLSKSFDIVSSFNNVATKASNIPGDTTSNVVNNIARTTLKGSVVQNNYKNNQDVSKRKSPRYVITPME